MHRLLAEVAADGNEALSEFKHQRFLETASVCEAVAASGEAISCYAQAAWHRPVAPDSDGHWAIEIAATADGEVSAGVVRFLISRLSPSASWVFWGRREIGREVAGRLGLVETRAIHNVAVALPLDERPSVPEGMRISGFQVGRDEEAWLAANNAAFSGHPENGAVTHEGLVRRFAEPWFDPAGLRMAWADDDLAGSCWTKVQPTGEGEIYIIGVHPRYQGKGLGRMLVTEGLRYLAEERHTAVGTLWVETTNRRALRLYHDMGFDLVRTVRAYESVSGYSRS